MGDHPDIHAHPQGAPPVDDFDGANNELANALRRSFGVLKLVMFVLIVVYLLSGWFSVSPGQRAVVYRFGAIVDGGTPRAVKGEGWHWSWPFPIDSVEMVDVQERNLPISFMLSVSDAERASGKIQAKFGPLSPDRDDYLLTGDENIIHASLEIRYQIDADAVVDYLGNVFAMPAAERDDVATRKAYEQHPEYSLLTNLARDAVIETAAGWEAMAIRGNRQDEFLKSVGRALERRLAALAAGGAPVGLKLRETGGVIAKKQMNLEAILPPAQTRDAFDLVFKSEQMKSQRIAMARSLGEARMLQTCGPNHGEIAAAVNKEFELLLALSAKDGADEDLRRQLAEQRESVESLLRASSGATRSIIRRAEIERDELVNEAAGDFDRLMSVLPEYAKNPEVYVSRRTAEMLGMALSHEGVVKMLVPRDLKRIWLKIPRDDSGPVAPEEGAEALKIDLDAIGIPEVVRRR